MAQDIVGGLFGIQQQPDYSAQDYRTAVAMAEMNSPKQMGRFLGGMLGAPLGRAVAQGVGGLLGVEDPRLQQASVIREAQQQGFDVTSPEGLQQLAQFFVQRGQPGLASQVAQQAQGMTSAASKMQLEQAQAYAALKKADAEKLSNYGRILVDSGFTPGTPEFINQMQKFATAELEGTSRRGNTVIVTPDSGKVKPSDIQTTINTKKDVLGDTGDILDNIGIARASLQGANVNPTSANQAYKSVAMVLKDKLLSNKDVRESLGKRGLLGRAEQTVESLMSGTLSPKVIKDANSYLNDIEKVIAPKYNKKVEQYNLLVDESNYSQPTRQSLYASPYEAAAPKSGLKEGQTGTSRSGRPMVVKNGKWEYQ